MAATPEAVIRAWFEEVWNRGDESAIDRLFHPDGVFSGLPTSDAEPIRGPVAFKPFHQAFRSAFPDLSIEVVRTVTEGDWSVAYCRVSGTHRGEGLGMPATNNGIDFRGFAMGRVKDGQLVEGWNAFDFLGMYQQLGVPLNLPAAD
jgi:steroid delta-isomerase-like uncharacterized protein